MVWSIVGKIADFGPGTLREVQIDGRTYAIANMDGTLFAIDGICGHAGDNMGSGKLIGAKVKSPVRGSVYDLRTERTLKSHSYRWPRQPTVGCPPSGSKVRTR